MNVTPELITTGIGAVDKGLFIGGAVREAQQAATFMVEDPATGEALCEVADAGPDDARAALDAAAAAQDAWAAVPPRERSEILRRTYELMGAARLRARGAHQHGDGQVGGGIR